MIESMATEIRSFYSLRDMRESIEKEVEQYQAVVDEYSQWLGSFLRDMEATHGDEDWFKKFSASQKALTGKAKRETEKEGKSEKSRKSGPSSDWISYKSMLLSASEQGEAELLFEAIEEINTKVEQLGKVKTTIENLEKSTISKDTVYIVYVRDGVPEKIVLRHKREKEFAEKFKFMADFSMLKEAYP
jgi:hypothetical protein